jgi:hypothetical protein
MEQRSNPMSLATPQVLQAPAQSDIWSDSTYVKKESAPQDLCAIDFNNCYIDDESKLHGCILHPDCDQNLKDGCHLADEGEGSKSTAMQRDVEDVPVEELRVCCGGCCSMTSLFCGFPSCIGCTCQGTVLVLMGKAACLKCLDCKDEHKKCCTLCVCDEYLVCPNKCCEMQSQTCCLDSRCAFPCSNKVPCIFTLLPFCAMGADWKMKTGCCKKTGELIPRLMERAGK